MVTPFVLPIKKTISFVKIITNLKNEQTAATILRKICSKTFFLSIHWLMKNVKKILRNYYFNISIKAIYLTGTGKK